jgi:hypothetical protein
MWHVFLSAAAEQTLEEYIVAYRNIFEQLYDDSGIWSEDYIIETHVTESKNLKNDILEHIDKRFVSDFLPFKNINSSVRESVIFVRNRIIFIEYIFHEEEKIRYIEKLRILYKK